MTKDDFLYKGKKANFHTHTTRCHHAVGEDREYVEAAIEAGFEILGFSDHSPQPLDEPHITPVRMAMDELEEYVDAITRLKMEYKKDIQILVGLETEYFPDYFQTLMKEVEKYPIDYMIMGQHCLEDEHQRTYVSRPRNDEVYLEKYINQVIEGLHTGKFLYVAHADIVNFIGSSEIYCKHMRRLAEELKRLDIPVEINVNGYRDGSHYPNRTFIQLALETGNDFLIGVDAHAPRELLDYETYNKCMGLVEELGLSNR